MCLDSDFFDLWRSCGDCNITYSQPECQLSCHSCLAGEGEDTTEHPAPRADQLLAIPDAGCSVDRRTFQLDCRPLSQGHCGEIWLADTLSAPASFFGSHCFAYHLPAIEFNEGLAVHALQRLPIVTMQTSLTVQPPLHSFQIPTRVLRRIHNTGGKRAVLIRQASALIFIKASCPGLCRCHSPP